MIFISLFFSFAMAQDCEIPFPLKTKSGLQAACLTYEKSYTIGHIVFYTFPRARTESDKWPYEFQYFQDNKSTRNRLCRLFGAKKESPRSQISDPAKEAIVYDENGFHVEPASKSLKVLACSLIDY